MVTMGTLNSLTSLHARSFVEKKYIFSQSLASYEIELAAPGHWVIFDLENVAFNVCCLNSGPRPTLCSVAFLRKSSTFLRLLGKHHRLRCPYPLQHPRYPCSVHHRESNDGRCPQNYPIQWGCWKFNGLHQRHHATYLLWRLVQRFRSTTWCWYYPQRSWTALPQIQSVSRGQICFWSRGGQSTILAAKGTVAQYYG